MRHLKYSFTHSSPGRCAQEAEWNSRPSASWRADTFLSLLIQVSHSLSSVKSRYIPLSADTSVTVPQLREEQIHSSLCWYKCHSPSASWRADTFLSADTSVTVPQLREEQIDSPLCWYKLQCNPLGYLSHFQNILAPVLYWHVPEWNSPETFIPKPLSLPHQTSSFETRRINDMFSPTLSACCRTLRLCALCAIAIVRCAFGSRTSNWLAFWRLSVEMLAKFSSSATNGVFVSK
jgi:hypothetical protein